MLHPTAKIYYSIGQALIEHATLRPLLSLLSTDVLLLRYNGKFNGKRKIKNLRKVIPTFANIYSDK